MNNKQPRSREVSQIEGADFGTSKSWKDAFKSFDDKRGIVRPKYRDMMRGNSNLTAQKLKARRAS